MERERALEIVKKHYSPDGVDDTLRRALESLIPELTESEDERIRQSLLAYIKGESKRLDTKKWIAYLEKQKEPYYTKRNALFDKCVAECDPEIIQRVSDEVDEMLGKEQKPLLPEDKVKHPLYVEGFEAGKEVGRQCEKVFGKQKEQKPVNYTFTTFHRDVVYSAMCNKNLNEGLRYNLEIVYKIIKELVDKTLVVEEQNPAEWKPQPESLEALMYAIEGKWERISPTSYLSRRLEDLYEGLVNTFNVDESFLAELPKVASRAYTAEGIEELRALKDKIEASMESPENKPAEWSEEPILSG